MKQIITFIVSTFIALQLTGCATSDLSYKNETITLRIKDSSLQVHGITLQEKYDNFSTLFLTQKLLRLDDGSLVAYEKARTDIQYQFEQTTPRSIKIIFDAKRVINVYYNTFIYAFQLLLADNRVLNVLVSQGYNQELQMLYGMSTEQLNKMLIKVDPHAQPVFYYKDVIDLRNEPKPFISNWTILKVHFVPLVIPLRLFWLM